jgi:DNA gyrase subunit A
MRGRTAIEDMGKDREAIVVTEVPYQVNKARMIERIAELVQDKTIDGIADIRDESDRDGVRVVVELKRDAVAEIVLNQLFRYTPLQTSFGVNTLALNAGRPEMLSLKQILEAFIDFREEVIQRRTAYELRKARERAHILVGLAIAVANLDAVIKLIREAADPAIARERLMATPWPAGDVAPLVALIDEPGRTVVDGVYRLSEEQAKAILDLRLHRLTGLERDKIVAELHEVGDRIRDYLEILASRQRVLDIMRTELLAMKEQFSNPRRTQIEEGGPEQDIEDLIQREDMVVTVTHGGYIKRVPLSTYRAQKRGGKGRAGMAVREQDFLSQVFVVDTHTPVVFFSSRGMAYKLKVYKLPLGTPQARGKALVNILPLAEGETVTAFLPLPEDEAKWGEMFAIFATSSGNVRRNSLADFVNVKANGKIAMKLENGERLIGVRTASEDDDVLLASALGKSIRFPVTDVRVFKGRDSVGVRGIRLAEGDRVISLSILRHVEATPEEREAYFRRLKVEVDAEAEAATGAAADADAEEADKPQGPIAALADERFAEMSGREQMILTVASSGFGRRSSAFDYPIKGRGGKGVVNMDLGRGQNEVVASFSVNEQDEIMLVTDTGQVIRIGVNEIRVARRGARGVTLFRVAEGERVVSVSRLSDDEAASEGAN